MNDGAVAIVQYTACQTMPYRLLFGTTSREDTERCLREKRPILTIPYITANLIDYAVSKDNDKLIFFSVVLGINILISIVIKILSYYAYSRFSLGLEKKLKEDLFKEFRKLKEYHPQQIEILFNEDIKHVVAKEVLVIPNFVKAVSKLVLAIGLLIYYDWKFLLVVLAFGLIGLVGAKIYSNHMKRFIKMY